jgi:hypothetical protein
MLTHSSMLLVVGSDLTGQKPLAEWKQEVRDRLGIGTEVTQLIIDFDSEEDFANTAYEFYSKATGENLAKTLVVRRVGSAGIDRGALTRAFFCKLFRLISQGNFRGLHLMVGEIGHILPDGTAENMDNAYINFVAKAIVHAVLQDCHGLLGFSPVITECLLLPKESSVCERRGLPFCDDDVSDQQLRQVLIKVSNKATDQY